MALAGTVVGADILVAVEDSGSPGTFNVVAGQRNARLLRGTTAAEADYKQEDFEMKEPAKLNWSVEADALLVVSDDAYEDLIAAWRSKSKVKIEIAGHLDPGANSSRTEQGLAIIADFPTEAPDAEMATISVTFDGADALEEVTVA